MIKHAGFLHLILQIPLNFAFRPKDFGMTSTSVKWRCFPFISLIARVTQLSSEILLSNTIFQILCKHWWARNKEDTAFHQGAHNQMWKQKVIYNYTTVRRALICKSGTEKPVTNSLRNGQNGNGTWEEFWTSRHLRQEQVQTWEVINKHSRSKEPQIVQSNRRVSFEK